jgi:hypothetical protein
VVVDVRHGSPTLGKHLAVELTAENRRVIWVPPGFAHGTFALEDDTIVLYECTGAHGQGEGGIYGTTRPSTSAGRTSRRSSPRRTASLRRSRRGSPIRGHGTFA